jgi:hypothetical protein|tara:strand:- start:85 stop:339 length:255 start_codon:yes stop_codon:yes gene_type:complete
MTAAEWKCGTCRQIFPFEDALVDHRKRFAARIHDDHLRTDRIVSIADTFHNLGRVDFRLKLAAYLYELGITEPIFEDWENPSWK